MLSHYQSPDDVVDSAFSVERKMQDVAARVREDLHIITNDLVDAKMCSVMNYSNSVKVEAA